MDPLLQKEFSKLHKSLKKNKEMISNLSNRLGSVGFFNIDYSSQSEILIPLKSPLVSKQNSQHNLIVHPTQTSRNVNYLAEIEMEKMKTEKTQYEFKNLYEKNLDLKASVIDKDRQIEQLKSIKNKEIDKLTQKLFEKDQEIRSLSTNLNHSEKSLSLQLLKKDDEIKSLIQRLEKVESLKKTLEEELNLNYKEKEKELIKIPLYIDHLKIENSKNNSEILHWKQKYVL